ncbi:hypothetical protein BC829DRAFT_393337 [Chytridium lagenaria]|nr:hypothetical protein BC829DRAFT_393337 [Chytridium lagenaria]
MVRHDGGDEAVFSLEPTYEEDGGNHLELKDLQVGDDENTALVPHLVDKGPKDNDPALGPYLADRQPEDPMDMSIQVDLPPKDDAENIVDMPLHVDENVVRYQLERALLDAAMDADGQEAPLNGIANVDAMEAAAARLGIEMVNPIDHDHEPDVGIGGMSISDYMTLWSQRYLIHPNLLHRGRELIQFNFPDTLHDINIDNGTQEDCRNVVYLKLWWENGKPDDIVGRVTNRAGIRVYVGQTVSIRQRERSARPAEAHPHRHICLGHFETQIDRCCAEMFCIMLVTFALPLAKVENKSAYARFFYRLKPDVENAVDFADQFSHTRFTLGS